jgi:hypothetical protein
MAFPGDRGRQERRFWFEVNGFDVWLPPRKSRLIDSPVRNAPTFFAIGAGSPESFGFPGSQVVDRKCSEFITALARQISSNYRAIAVDGRCEGHRERSIP